VIIQATGANFASIQAVFDRLGVPSIVSNDPHVIQSADKVIMPGVGSAGYAMNQMDALGLSTVIRNLTQPVLGICLGQQLLCQSSEEDDAQLLGIIPLSVNRIQDAPVVPHMGWNNLDWIQADHPLLAGLTPDDHFYFVHGYGVSVDERYTLATCDYGMPFSAIIHANNYYGVQFHPEKSGASGERLLQNFLKYL
jgi:glutamine amidotransferase